LKCCAKAILKAVLPIAVGPTMVIKYFIVLLAQMGVETPDLYLFVFFGIKERPTEAPFMP